MSVNVRPMQQRCRRCGQRSNPEHLAKWDGWCSNCAVQGLRPAIIEDSPRPIPVYIVEHATQKNNRIAIKATLLLLLLFSLWVGLALN